MLTIIALVNLALNMVLYLVVAQAIMSWLVAFNVLNLHQRVVHQIWYAMNRITEPLYRPIRRYLPDMGGIDISPLIVIFGIIAIQTVIAINFLPMAYGG
ncbi:MAG TPA: YggT family protein [Thermohalobaculum sp.]|nr:YggT family protein [Thermohalobaculum sp.]